MRVTDDLAHARKRSYFLRRALRITAGHDDPAIGILAANASNGRPGILVGSRGDGTGIQNYDLGFERPGSADRAVVAKLPLDRGAVCLGGTASEVFYVKAGHGSILA